MGDKVKEIVRSNAMRWLLVWIAQLCIFAFSGIAAVLLRFEPSVPSKCLNYLLWALPVWLVVKSIVFHSLNLNRRGLRYVSIVDVYRLPTHHEKVRIFVGNCISAEDTEAWLDSLRDICQARDVGRLAIALKEIVLDYSPSSHLLKRIVETPARHSVAPVYSRRARKASMLQLSMPG